MRKLNWFALCLLLIINLTGGGLIAQTTPAAPKQGTQQDKLPSEPKRQKDLGQQKQAEEQPLKATDLEIDGLIVDETITKIGRDFYEIFHRQWEAPPMAANYIILIKERPTIGNGAFVAVSVNEEEVFEYQLQPRQDMIEEAANYTVSVLYEFLVNDQLNKQLEAEGRKEKEVF